MKHKLFTIISVFIIFGITLSLVSVAFAAKNQNSDIKTRKIVIFKKNVLNKDIKKSLIERHGGIKIKDLDIVNGAATLLSPKEEQILLNQNEILRVDDDVEVSILVRPPEIQKSRKIQPNEITPWNITRINAQNAWDITSGDIARVAVIDTGIDIKHPDLINNLKGGFSAVGYTTSYNDDNGHGTHVAGIIAAMDNTIGVIGAAPQADLYAVKVLDRRGSGYLSDVIEGIDWAITNNMQVINMSLGTTTNIISFQEAIQRANAAGIIQVVAAGNSGGAVNYPAAYPEVIAVSATDNTNTIASWSSRGPEVDLAAPGVSIYSTYKGQTYKTLSGTSMAAPHVAASAALILTTLVGSYDSNNDGIWNPNEVQNKLQDRATDLGDNGFDNLYGFGLVNTHSAVLP